MHPTQTRRRFLSTLTAATLGLGALASSARADEKTSVLDESDPTAKALGYKADSTKVDAKKHPQHKPTQTCADCVLYVGKATDAEGLCTAFPGKRVAAKGWCMAYAKKP